MTAEPIDEWWRDASTPGAPQPWDFDEASRETYMAEAFEQEVSGSRLVVEVLVDAYPDPMCEGDGWFVESRHYIDYRTGEYIWGYDPEESEPDGELDGLVMVERRLYATM